MYQWRVIALSALAVLLQIAGLFSRALPESYEGPTLYAFNELHAISALDGLGTILLITGCLVAWGAGTVWQRQVYATQ